jgi:hypothetical protein
MEKLENIPENILFEDIRLLIEDTKKFVSKTLATSITAMYWNIGKRINNEVLANKRAEYGKQIVATLSRQLIIEYGNQYEVKNLRRMMQFAQVFNDAEIVATLWRQLSWSHFKILIPVKDDVARDFYAQMCCVEDWNVKILKSKINSMLFERTAISKCLKN